MSQELGGYPSESAGRLRERGLEQVQLSLWQRSVLFGAAYFACAEGSTWFSAKGSPDLSFWLPSGLYLAVLLLNEYKSWPWLVLAATVASAAFDALHGTPAILIVVFSLANTTQALLGAWLVRTFVAHRPTMTRLQDYAGLVFFAGVLSTFLGAAVSTTGQVLAGTCPSFTRTFSVWWGNNTMVVLIVSPFVLVWCSEWLDWRAMRLGPKKLLEAAALVVGLTVASWAILVLGKGASSPHKYPFILFMMWAGLRFGVRGATAVSVLLAVLVFFCIQHYQKGLTPADLESRVYLLTMQGALAAATTVALVPAIVLAERRKTLEDLRESESKFSKAFRSSPNGIAIAELATGRYIDVNDSFCGIFGYTKEEMIGRTAEELGVFENAEARERVIAPVRDVGQANDCEVRLRTRRGEFKTLSLNAERIELGGRQCAVWVVFDITKRLQTEQQLEATSRQLRALSRRLQFLREEERTHLAREIHDHLGQLLTALVLDLRLVERRVAGVTDDGLRAALQGKIASARTVADEIITSVQKIAAELRPAILDRVGLEAAIETETQAFQSRTGVRCEWTLPSTPLALEPDQATAIFRIFQEILTNVARHAQAAHLTVRLVQEEDALVLEVEDDGVGIHPGETADPSSLGLLGMTERAAIMGGKISFGRGERGGTRVMMEIPLRRKAGQPA
jgi:PAS domain S-box-containing protein